MARLEQEGAQDQRKKEAEHKRQRQPKRREERRQHGIQRGDDEGDEERVLPVGDVHARKDRGGIITAAAASTQETISRRGLTPIRSGRQAAAGKCSVMARSPAGAQERGLLGLELPFGQHALVAKRGQALELRDCVLPAGPA